MEARTYSLEQRSIPYHKFNTIFRFLDKYLPKWRLTLDAGSGAGIYAIALAKRGYDAIFLDYSRENLKTTRQEIKKGVTEKSNEWWKA